MAEKVTALETVRQPSASTAMAYEPRNFDEAMRLATVFAASGLLGEVRNEAAALLVMATGAELGISATTALRSIYIVKGKPMMSSDLMVGLCLKRTDVCEYFICVETTEQQAAYETKRRGVTNPIRHTFSMADAQRAGLAGGQGMYSKYPATMLRHRCAAELARQVYPDIVLGLYSEAERDDVEALDVTPKAQQLVTEPVRTREEPEETIQEAMARWRSELFTVFTIAECDKIGRQIGKRLQKGTPEHAAMQEVYRARVKELKTAHERPRQEPKTETVDCEIVDEREPGAEG